MMPRRWHERPTRHDPYHSISSLSSSKWKLTIYHGPNVVSDVVIASYGYWADAPIVCDPFHTRFSNDATYTALVFYVRGMPKIASDNSLSMAHPLVSAKVATEVTEVNGCTAQVRAVLTL